MFNNDYNSLPVIVQDTVFGGVISALSYNGSRAMRRHAPFAAAVLDTLPFITVIVWLVRRFMGSDFQGGQNSPRNSHLFDPSRFSNNNNQNLGSTNMNNTNNLYSINVPGGTGGYRANLNPNQTQYNPNYSSVYQAAQSRLNRNQATDIRPSNQNNYSSISSNTLNNSLISSGFIPTTLSTNNYAQVIQSTSTSPSTDSRFIPTQTSHAAREYSQVIQNTNISSSSHHRDFIPTTRSGGGREYNQVIQDTSSAPPQYNQTEQNISSTNRSSSKSYQQVRQS